MTDLFSCFRRSGQLPGTDTATQRVVARSGTPTSPATERLDDIQTKAHFAVREDISVQGKWFLDGIFDGSGTEIDFRNFTHGKPLTISPKLRVSLYDDPAVAQVTPPLTVSLIQKKKGEPLDFSFTFAGVPVVSSHVGELLEAVAGPGIQRIPVLIEPETEGFEIINVVSLVDCMDTERTQCRSYWEANDGLPNLAGGSDVFVDLAIDAERTGDHHIFRVKRYHLPIIVSDAVKRLFERSHVSGIDFQARIRIVRHPVNLVGCAAS